MAGIRNSSGDALVYLDIDLQDPPELIPKMYKYYLEHNYDVVFTTRSKRYGEGIIKNYNFLDIFIKKNHIYRYEFK